MRMNGFFDAMEDALSEEPLVPYAGPHYVSVRRPHGGIRVPAPEPEMPAGARVPPEHERFPVRTVREDAARCAIAEGPRVRSASRLGSSEQALRHPGGAHQCHLRDPRRKKDRSHRPSRRPGQSTDLRLRILMDCRTGVAGEVPEHSGALLVVSHNASTGLWTPSLSQHGLPGNLLERLRTLVAQRTDYVANQKRLAQLGALVERFCPNRTQQPRPRMGSAAAFAQDPARAGKETGSGKADALHGPHRPRHGRGKDEG